MGLPMVEEYLLEPVDVVLSRQLAAYLADDLVVLQPFPAQVYAAEQRPFQVPVELPDQPSVGTAGPVLQEHERQLAPGAEDRGGALFGLRQAEGRNGPVPGHGRMNLAQEALEETLEEPFELFLLGGERKTVLEIGNSTYLGYSILDENPVFRATDSFSGFCLSKIHSNALTYNSLCCL